MKVENDKWKLLGKFSLLSKIAFIYILINIFVVLPLNIYFSWNIDVYPSIFRDENRLFKYDKVPDISMRGHWINKYIRKAQKSIIMIGDSTVEDFYVPYDKSIAGLLDSELFPHSDTPNIFNFGSSGTKSIYVFERIKKACEYKPDMIVWQLGAGSFPEVNWVFSSKYPYDLSLGRGLIGAYKNISKLNDQNAPFVSTELRSRLVPLFGSVPYYDELIKGYMAKRSGQPLRYPNDRHLKVKIGDVKITEKFHNIPFDEANRNFDVIEEVSRYVRGKGIKLVIYISPINQSILAQKYEAGYYDKLYSVIERYSKPFYVPILNLYDAVPDHLFIDGGHLKEEGDAIVAGRLAEFLKQEME